MKRNKFKDSPSGKVNPVGNDKRTKSKECTECHGTGTYSALNQSDEVETVECSKCDGRGVV